MTLRLLLDPIDAYRLPIATVARELSDYLTPSLVAKLTGAPEAQAVHHWAMGRTAPSPDREIKLRFALFLTRSLLTTATPEKIARWLQDYNARLQRTPASLLREASVDEFSERLMEAADAFMDRDADERSLF